MVPSLFALIDNSCLHRTRPPLCAPSSTRLRHELSAHDQRGCLCSRVPIYSKSSAAAVCFSPTVQVRAEDKISSEKPLIKFPVPKQKLKLIKLFKTQLQIIIFSCIYLPHFAECPVFKIWLSPGHIFPSCLHPSPLPCTMDQVSVQAQLGLDTCKATIPQSPFKLHCCNMSELARAEMGTKQASV